MRTTLIIDDDLLKEARELSGEKEKTKLVHAGLRSLVEREAAKRLAALAGTVPAFRVTPRRRSMPGR